MKLRRLKIKYLNVIRLFNIGSKFLTIYIYMYTEIHEVRYKKNLFNVIK